MSTPAGFVSIAWDPVNDGCPADPGEPGEPPAQVPVTPLPPADVAAAIAVQPAFTG